MNKVYLVIHCYETDGGFGDAVCQKEVLCGFKDKDEAEIFIKKYENPHVYEKPYAELECGCLVIEELCMTPPQKEEMWWLE